jgi:chondroitin AC lyase
MTITPRLHTTLFGTILIAALIFAAMAAPVSADDIAVIKQRLRASLMEGTPPSDTQATDLLASLQPDGSWSGIDYKNRDRAGWPARSHLGNLLLIARACKTPGHPRYDDPQTVKSVISSLDFWLKNDFKNPNWWFNRIGTPKLMANIHLLMEDNLSDAQKKKSLEIIKRGKLGMTGQNLVWVAEITAKRAVLENNPELLKKAIGRIVSEIRLSMKEGIQPDYSFHQHGPCLYSHGYGSGFSLDCSRIAGEVAGTAFALPGKKIEVLCNYILDGQCWMMRGRYPDYHPAGRQIVRKNQNVDSMYTVARNMLKISTGREAEFRALQDRVKGGKTPPLFGNRHFWRSDFMTHHRPGFYTSAKMYSSRTKNTDGPVNREGPFCHHLSDGGNYLFLKGDEYADIFPVWDWRKVPGTTVVNDPIFSGKCARKGEGSFVGGVSDGTYGMAAFDFVREELSAHKAWAFFDDEYVCLGAGITCSSTYPVITTLNQCHLKGKDVHVSYAGKMERGTHMLKKRRWVYHNGVAYVSLKRTNFHLQNDKRRGSWNHINPMYPLKEVEHEVFTLWLDHGQTPRNAEYAYIVVPGIDLKKVDEYARTTRIEILNNTPQLQAVYHRSKKITMAAFYQPGRVRTPDALEIAVDQPCLLLVQKQGNELNISLSNPNNEPLTVGMEVNRSLLGKGVTPLKDERSSKIVMHLPAGQQAGKSVSVSYKM